MIQRLTPTAKSLCSRVALEQTRPQQWLISRQLRSEAIARVSAGQSESDVLGWLQGMLDAAVSVQTSR